MKFKFDENLGQRGISLLAASEHDVSTISSQDMEGANDDLVIEICRIEERCLVTLDMDFANPISFPPKRYAGIVVLRPAKKATLSDIHECLTRFLAALKNVQDLKGKLWIISPTQIREYTP
ncbi:MAG: DUF5615 family PIN-like protein [Opitutales bacterium]|nr:DUF5615 family PIN-like protein [Opitutales bacterium]